MTHWTDTAKSELEQYFNRIRPTVVASGADAAEVIEDLRRHLDAEIRAAQLSVVTDQDVRRLLARFGAPEAPDTTQAPKPASATPPPPTAASTHRPPGWLGSGWFIFAGVLLPVVTLLLGALLRAMWEKGAIPRALALALVLGWVGWGLVSLSRDIRGRFLRPEYPPSPGSGGQVQEALAGGGSRSRLTREATSA